MKRIEVTISSNEIVSKELTDDVLFLYQSGKTNRFISLRCTEVVTYDQGFGKFADTVNSKLLSIENGKIIRVTLLNDDTILFDQADLNVDEVRYQDILSSYGEDKKVMKTEELIFQIV